MYKRELYYRLQSCLETILGLEDELEECDLADLLRNELGMLRAFASHVPAEHLSEKDVERIEAATSAFLRHLALPFQARRRELPRDGLCKRVQ